VRDVLRYLADALRAYIVGQLLTMTFLGALTAAGLYILDVPYWLTFGIFTGLVAVVSVLRHASCRRRCRRCSCSADPAAERARFTCYLLGCRDSPDRRDLVSRS